MAIAAGRPCAAGGEFPVSGACLAQCAHDGAGARGGIVAANIGQDSGEIWCRRAEDMSVEIVACPRLLSDFYQNDAADAVPYTAHTIFFIRIFITQRKF